MGRDIKISDIRLFKTHKNYSQEMAKLSLRVKDKFNVNYDDLKRYRETDKLYDEGEPHRKEFFRVNRAFSDALEDSLFSFHSKNFIDRQALEYVSEEYKSGLLEDHRKRMAYKLAEAILEHGKFIAEESEDWRGLESTLSVVVFSPPEER